MPWMLRGAAPKAYTQMTRMRKPYARWHAREGKARHYWILLERMSKHEILWDGRPGEGEME